MRTALTLDEDRRYLTNDRDRSPSPWLRRAAAVMLSGLLALPVAAVRAAEPLGYDEREEAVTLPNRTLTLTCARPRSASRPPDFLVLFASGDGGMRGGSQAIYEHLAEHGNFVAAFSSKEALKPVKSAGGVMRLAEATADISAMMREAKRLLELPESTPTVVSGESRGANMVVFAAGDPRLQPGIAGAVAIALTREADYLELPDSTGFQLDERGRVQTYPALARLGSIPIAVIQSTHDKYVPSAESRRLLGADTATRRLYQVESRNHGFGGGRDLMLSDLDEALTWIAAALPARGGTAR